MKAHSTTPLRHSTVAQFELVVNQTSYGVGEVAGGFIHLRSAADIPPGEADLYIRVEGEEDIHRRICLPEGASIDSPRVVIQRMD